MGGREGLLERGSVYSDLNGKKSESHEDQGEETHTEEQRAHRLHIRNDFGLFHEKGSPCSWNIVTGNTVQAWLERWRDTFGSS